MILSLIWCIALSLIAWALLRWARNTRREKTFVSSYNLQPIHHYTLNGQFTHGTYYPDGTMVRYREDPDDEAVKSHSVPLKVVVTQ